jgi:hypothetical protein
MTSTKAFCGSITTRNTQTTVFLKKFICGVSQIQESKFCVTGFVSRAYNNRGKSWKTDAVIKVDEILQDNIFAYNNFSFI